MSKNKLLFDPKKHDPLKFNHLNKKKSNDGYSLSTTSSTIDDSRDHYKDKEKQRRKRRDARSQSSHDSKSSNNSNSKKSKDEPTSAFLVQLKRAYRDIMDTENKLIDERRLATTSSKVSLFGQKSNDDLNWIRLVNKHKALADAYHNFLATSLAPHTPTSLHALPQKYNIPTRLWQNAFHGLLEKMRSSLNPNNPNNTLDHLSDFVYHAYAFYTNLLEEPVLSPFKASWIEALGDLARYRMAVSSIESANSSNSPTSLPTSFTTPAPASPNEARIDDSQNDRPPAAMEVASVGLPALRAGGFDIEDRHLWRQVARDWYGQGLRDMPGTGRLQHHLGILCRNSQDSDESLRALYHLCKALTTSHPYTTARETLLSLFDPELQNARKLENRATELFTYAHGILFTKIELDTFPQALDKLLKHLKAESGSLPDVVWIMMGVVNITSLLQYGQDDSILKRTANTVDDAFKRQKQLHTSSSNHSLNSASAFNSPVPPVPALPQAIMMHSNPKTGSSQNLLSSSPRSSHSFENLNRPGSSASTRSEGGDDDVVLSLNKEPAGEEYNTSKIVFEYAQELTFSIFNLLLNNPTSELPGSPLNPYITIVMTYLITILKQSTVLSLLEKKVPWIELSVFLSKLLPNKSTLDKGTKSNSNTPQGPQLSRLVSGAPLPEDWCLRGMEWVGRRVYERGFWKARTGTSTGASYSGAPPPVPGSQIQSEMDVLSNQQGLFNKTPNGSTPQDGLIESDDEDDLEKDLSGLGLSERDESAPTKSNDLDSPLKLAQRRLARLAFSSAILTRLVQGFDLRYLDNENIQFVVRGELEEKIQTWRAEEARKQEDELRRLEGLYQNNTDSDIDSDDLSDVSSLSSAIDSDDDDDEIKQLKIRRKELKNLMREQKKDEIARQQGHTTVVDTLQPGYTTLVFDTNVMLYSIEYVQTFIDSESWICVVPLAVITELDGLSKSDNALGNAALIATSYLDVAVERSKSLKIQTSKNNFLNDLTMRYEDYAVGGMEGFEERKTLDDVILDVAKWQNNNWVERNSSVNAFSLNSPPQSPTLSSSTFSPTLSQASPVRSTAVPFKQQQAKKNITSSKVALITYDRNLRLKGHAVGVTTVNEVEFSKLHKKFFNG
ncbi:hypothetical protein E3Q23_03635 [Wallemia mellicola]|uniref:PIN domain-containing protein n=1 Tax=Wallemia mellicola TaxID=1708541 RepID=A0A4T0TC81_9BASI|nr:hypothetical protein E3Q23_03635 [Wallemia mellicola]TIC62974.1 hypothetical protein E3Q01_03631 [Wallemia mellicola]